jgi:hypothetical protein
MPKRRRESSQDEKDDVKAHTDNDDMDSHPEASSSHSFCVFFLCAATGKTEIEALSKIMDFFHSFHFVLQQQYLCRSSGVNEVKNESKITLKGERDAWFYFCTSLPTHHHLPHKI